jgi:hypothetical protein
MYNKILIIELHHLPCIQYFVYLKTFKRIIIDFEDHYTKQTYRNRCYINGANKVQSLIIPIKKNRTNSRLTANVEIDYGQKWLGKHLRAIQSAYGKSPFFEYYADEFFDIFKKQPRYLQELNRELLTKCLEILNFDLDLEFGTLKEENTENLLYEAKNEINPKNIIDRNSVYHSREYFQVFGKNFVSNLSVIDLIFCEGPQASDIIEKSCACQ